LLIPPLYLNDQYLELKNTNKLSIFRNSPPHRVGWHWQWTIITSAEIMYEAYCGSVNPVFNIKKWRPYLFEENHFEFLLFYL